ncbi:hypothetical protein K0651_07960 [Ornithinimicrobium sp. Arc0846-15]|nr:hypothetical protein [Ornithinimicrobium laminariae]
MTSPVDQPGWRRAFDWLFRSRETGNLTIAQFPNWPILVWAGGTVLTRFIDGMPGAIFQIIATAALTYWALLELFRGEAPFRRALGAGALIWVVTGLISIR